MEERIIKTINNMDIEDDIKERVIKWLNYDNLTSFLREEIIKMLNNKNELIDSFYQELEFGTGGLRGKIGAGSNKINIYTIGMATQGLANYINIFYKSKNIKKSVVIAYDSRRFSKEFSEEAGKILTGNGIKAYIFKTPHPTPLLSYAVRKLHATAGIVITASHNPPEYNGYKVYWSDGGQIVPPHDINIINEVKKITDFDMIKKNTDFTNIEFLNEVIDNDYCNDIYWYSLSKDLIKEKAGALTIIYTPLHGTGFEMIDKIFNRFGFTNVFTVPEQKEPDGNFPTLDYPNPEDPKSFHLALEWAKIKHADLVIANDPDADRMGIGIPKDKNKTSYILLNGNQIFIILLYYRLLRLKETNRLKKNGFIVKTIVTTDLVRNIADSFEIKTLEVLTGFKYIGEKIRQEEEKQKEGKKNMEFIFGGEESYGTLFHPLCRDKDAISAAAMISEATLWANSQGLSLLELLNSIYEQYGFYKEKLLTKKFEGRDGQQTIKEIIKTLRENPPISFAGIKVKFIYDYKTQTKSDTNGKVFEKISLPISNVLSFHLEDNTKITIRPSGTEPKIKFYISIRSSGKNLKRAEKEINKKITIISDYLETLLAKYK